MNIHKFIKTLGPGILFASTAIGVSHLVQSTRAGAEYGFSLLWAIVFANLFKYPFFEYGSRYANATGVSLIDGYYKMGGRWMIGLYFLITVFSMFFVTAAVAAVTAGFMDNLFNIHIYTTKSFQVSIGVLFAVCLIILLFGKYHLLDKLIKIIGAVLLITTITAFILALIHGPRYQVDLFSKKDMQQGIGFIIALMGWMPTAVDLSTWNSLWTVERIKETGYHPKLKETLLEFNLGYWISAGLSICFVTMGAFLMYGSEELMPDKAHLFASKVVELYTETIGGWSHIIIAASAFSIMFGTAIAVFDGYARALERTSELLFLSAKSSTKELMSSKFYQISLLIIAAGSLIILFRYSHSLKNLVDLATTISFLIAPVIAIVNFRLVSKKYISAEYVPGKIMQVLSYLGIIFLTGFSLMYLKYIFTN